MKHDRPEDRDAQRLLLESPTGRLIISANDEAIVAIDWWQGESGPNPTEARSPLLQEAAAQLAAYFAGSLRSFDLPLAPAGSAFARRVYQAMCEIPYGETRSYGALARQLGSSARAVGGACGRNPIPIVIPCHRVLASGHGPKALGGYSGGRGLATKRQLLELEGALAPWFFATG